MSSSQQVRADRQNGQGSGPTVNNGCQLTLVFNLCPDGAEFGH
jgi:hypothetical protein